MPRYTVNDRAVARARELIETHQYVLDSDWGNVQPKAADENAYLESPQRRRDAELGFLLAQRAGIPVHLPC